MTEQRPLRHIPNAELAVHALDGNRTAWSAPAARHLSVCPVCREQLTVYERVVEAGRHTYPGDVLQTPPPHVWEAVRADVAADRPRPPRRVARDLLLCTAHLILRCASALLRALSRTLTRLRPDGPHGPRL
ncbi:hypothetical protein [Streptomyces sp. MMBL 11-3]|uniref:hypothetical protein n=1 Tax=Streptomyces sp. MMBL 11-3 TaxID=3382639 RepID=UPI0039B599CB